MSKSDLTIGQDDLEEIFGGKLEIKGREAVGVGDILFDSAPAKAPEKKSGTVKPAPESPAKKEETKIIIRSKAEEAYEAQAKAEAQAKIKEEAKPKEEQSPEPAVDPLPPMDSENDVDDLIKRAQEIENEMKQEFLENESLKFTDFLNERTLMQVLEVFDEVRKIVEAELSAFIEQKAISHMMLRTLEKTAVSFIILKNSNWNSGGKLRENGSIDIERVIKNTETYNSQIQELDKEVEEALKTIFYMRIKSVRLGLGKERYAVLKEKLMTKLNIIKAGYKKEVVNFIKGNVIVPAFEKGDEEK